MGTPEEECGRKVRYDQRKDAVDAIARMVRGNYAGHGEMAVYKCEVKGCCGFHIGRSKKARKGFPHTGRIWRKEA